MNTKLCVIAPPHDMFASLYGDMIFVQADWIKQMSEKDLAKFLHLRNNKYLIIDNQHPFSTKNTVGQVESGELLEIAAKIGANEIVVPDVIGDRFATIRSAYLFIDLYKQQHKHFNLMFVPQGFDEFDWFECYQWFASAFKKNIDVIGIPKWLSEISTNLRLRLLNHIDDKFHIHFLGCATGWGEFVEIPRRVRSWDTSLLYSLAQQGKSIADVGAYTKVEFNMDPKVLADPLLLVKSFNEVKYIMRPERIEEAD